MSSAAGCASTEEQSQRTPGACQRTCSAPDTIIDVAHPLQVAHPLPQPEALTVCTICFEAQSAAVMHNLAGCGHSFCRPCLQTYATVAIGLRSIPITCVPGRAW